ncbi:MAG: hypothetical protein VX876_06655 [Planctomycetota bacterium]|nr:hypothetical protein [Planctomycetota bacterium]
MKQQLFSCCCCLLLMVWSMPASAAQEEFEAQRTVISALIEKLGSSDFTTRELAQSRLKELGLVAFDQLHEAQTDNDIEVAKRATYLIRSLQVQWSLRTDAPEVRRLLAKYDEKNPAGRRSLMEQLASLPDSKGLEALSRMVRFESDGRQSRYAALQLMKMAVPEVTDQKEAYATRLQELHALSSRTAARWMEAYSKSLLDAEGSLPLWDQATRKEEQLLTTFPGRTSRGLVRDLLRRQFGLLRQLERQEEAAVVARRSVNLLDGSREQLIEAIDWFASEKSWMFAEVIADRFPVEFQEYPELMYRLAEAFLEGGDEERANQQAAIALAINPDDLDAHLTIASFLASRQRHSWAIAEYQQGIQQAPLESEVGVRMRILLGEIFHDLRQDNDARLVFEPVVENRENDDLKQSVIRFYSRMESFVSRYWYFRACDHASRQQWDKQRECLEAGFNEDSDDGDILIAMYRFNESDEAFRAKALEAIQSSVTSYEDQIKAIEVKIKNTLDRLEKQRLQWDLARAFNQYAWLVCNTTGDYQKAVDYSVKSLEIRNWESASYLDTLGHAYFAAKDFENAVKYQQQAVDKDPGSVGMRRQLKVFQDALNKQRTNQG